MYGGFTDPEALRRVSYGGVVVDDVNSQIAYPLVDLVAHTYHSRFL